MSLEQVFGEELRKIRLNKRMGEMWTRKLKGESSIMSEEIYEYMREIAGEKPETFAEYFFSDVFNYVFPENDDDSRKLADEPLLTGVKRRSLLACSSSREVKHWMNNAVSMVVMRLDVDLIISEYFGA